MRFYRSLLLAAAGVAATLTCVGDLSAQAQKTRCLVSGKEVEVKPETRPIAINTEKTAFCCPNCTRVFVAAPEKFVKSAGNCMVDKNTPAKVSVATRVVLNNGLYYMCCANGPKAFAAKPEEFVTELPDPVTGNTFAPKADSHRITVGKQIYLFETAENKAEFEKDPAKYTVEFK